MINKVASKWVKNLNVKSKTIKKWIEDNVGKHLVTKVQIKDLLKIQKYKPWGKKDNGFDNH